MRSHASKRHVALFLIAIILPCLLLVGLGLRLIDQERQLAENRVAGDRRRMVREAHQQLLARLERIKLQEVSALARDGRISADSEYQDPSIVMVARLDEGNLVLPWEQTSKIAEGRPALSERFDRAMERGEHEEFARTRPDSATPFYREALEHADEPAQAAIARLTLARALARSGRPAQAQAQHRELLSLPFEVVDESRVPFALYAAERLAQTEQHRQSVQQRIAADIDSHAWLSPPATYLRQRVVDQLVEAAPTGESREAAQRLQKAARGDIERLKLALTLRRRVPELEPSPDGWGETRQQPPEPVWILHGAGTWLASSSSVPGSGRVVVVVETQPVFDSLLSQPLPSLGSVSDLQFVTDLNGEGEPLGPSFPGVKLRFLEGHPQALASQLSPRRYFYGGVLLLVVVVTLFSAYLWWRDVRRDVRMAEMRSRFVSSVSHELKTPLTSIRMFAESLRMGRSTAQSCWREYLDTIIGESERLSRLLNNVLHFSRIEQGNKVYDFKPTALQDVVQAATRAIQYHLVQQGFQLQVDVQEDLSTVPADADAVEQAILNLLTNAMKYSGDSRRIELRLFQHNGYAVVEVADHGVGIDPEQRTLIFDEFYRAPTPENDHIPGTGLGLTLAAHAADAHRGRIEVRSEPGKGSSFSLHLPMEAET